ncbi:unnamed protein product [Arabis nemorensis]|uniref:Uncharacterized protein n=1 Tax=Arabis nemorensis TaxID=586526 RepID=A0A565BQD1_9BRAS|nr:unnamed protein product [Arabis nemorensis]
MSMSRNRARVSPYPLRSSRSNNQISPDQSPIQTGGVREWEDVRCVICMEPPHNAVLLHCSSSSNGCRAYMCDTSVQHSNCFKRYRKNNKNCLNPKSLNCPLCRGEVYETINVKSARRFMNAKKRYCTKQNCDFSGTYSELKNHLKVEHRVANQPNVVEVMNEAGILQGTEVVHHQPPPIRLVIQVGDDGIVQNIFGLNELRTHLDQLVHSTMLQLSCLG